MMREPHELVPPDWTNVPEPTVPISSAALTFNARLESKFANAPKGPDEFMARPPVPVTARVPPVQLNAVVGFVVRLIEPTESVPPERLTDDPFPPQIVSAPVTVATPPETESVPAPFGALTSPPT